MALKYAYVLPILCAVDFFAAIIITYIISVHKGDVTPILPLISDIGAVAPQSCIFGLLFNIGTILIAASMYIRYVHVRYMTDKQASSLEKRNLISLYFGLTACCGLFVLSNFQRNKVPPVHQIGGVVAFGCGCIYQCMHTYISFHLYPVFGNRKVNIARLLLSVISCITCCLTSSFTFYIDYDAELHLSEDDSAKWTNNDIGYEYHLIAALTEWILGSTTLLFLSSLSYEFKNIVLSEPYPAETTATKCNFARYIEAGKY